MAQFTDPRMGDRRNKKLLNKIAAKAMARKGLTSRIGTFGRLSSAGAGSRGMRPLRGGGGKSRFGARPAGYGNVFDGLHGRQGAQPHSPGYVNTAPVQAPVPDMYRSPQAPEAAVGGAPGTPPPGDPAGLAWVQQQMEEAGLDPSTAIYSPAQGDISAPEPGMISAGGPLPGQQESMLSQVGPSGAITAPGGLIPLGDGRYYDPATDQIFGGGGGSSARNKVM